MFGFLRRKKKQVPGDTAIESPVDSSVHAPVVESNGSATAEEPVEAPNAIAPESIDAAITEEPEPAQPSTQIAIQTAPQPVTQEKPKSRFWQQLARARNNFTEGLGDLFLGKKAIDDELLEEVETRLIMADVGQATTRALIDALHQQISRKQINDAEALFETLSQLMVERLERVQKPRPVPTEQPHIIVVCGINGAGKTTTIANWHTITSSPGTR